jgi:HrpA-like RNA helicase
MGYDPIDFPYMAAPATETVARALGILVTLQAVAYTTAGLRITNRGRALSSLPVNIWNALMVLNSPDHDCQDAVLSLVSMLEAVDSGGSVWIPCGSEQYQAALEHLQQSNGDHIMLLNIYLAWCEAGFARKKVGVPRSVLSERKCDESRRLDSHPTDQVLVGHGRHQTVLGPGTPYQDDRPQVLCSRSRGHRLRQLPSRGQA